MTSFGSEIPLAGAALDGQSMRRTLSLRDFGADVEVGPGDRDLGGRDRHGLARNLLNVVIGGEGEHAAGGDGQYEHDEDPHSSHVRAP